MHFLSKCVENVYYSHWGVMIRVLSRYFTIYETLKTSISRLKYKKISINNWCLHTKRRLYNIIDVILSKFNNSKVNNNNNSPMEDILVRIDKLRQNAGERYGINPEKCHYGHLVLEGLLDRPTAICQIDAATNTTESNISLALRTMRLASAMDKFGLKVGDSVVIMAANHLDVAVPFYAINYMGYSMCSMDPGIELTDVQKLIPIVKPKIIFCQADCVEKNEQALQSSGIEAHIVTLDDKENDLENFIGKYKGTEINFKPATYFDTSDVPAWLLLTSGSTGTPKVAMVSYDSLLNAVKEWWIPVPEKVNMNMILISTQWLSTLVYTAAAPIKPYAKLQSSKPITPQIMVHMINTYKPNVTAWTPYLLARFVQAPQKVTDLSCFTHILIGGSAPEKKIIEGFKTICNAKLHIAYGMTELTGGVFDYDEPTTPWGSCGKANETKYQYRLIDYDGNNVKEPHKPGELWVKGKYFFKGYLGNSEETRQTITEDGWIMTGDIFYRDEHNYYYFVERKKALIRYLTSWISPLEIEAVIRQHPGVAEVCVVAISNPETMELAVAAVLKKPGQNVEPQEIFKLVNSNLSERKRLHGGLFFVEAYPQTASGKINRSEVVKMAQAAQRFMP